jgi:hypothetical protein
MPIRRSFRRRSFHVKRRRYVWSLAEQAAGNLVAGGINSIDLGADAVTRMAQNLQGWRCERVVGWYQLRSGTANVNDTGRASFAIGYDDDGTIAQSYQANPGHDWPFAISGTWAPNDNTHYAGPGMVFVDLRIRRVMKRPQSVLFAAWEVAAGANTRVVAGSLRTLFSRMD